MKERPVTRTDRLAKLVVRTRGTLDKKKLFGSARRMSRTLAHLPEVTVNLAEATMMAMQGNHSEQEVLGLSENDGVAIARFGLSLLAQGQLTEAEGAGRLATALAPSHFEAWVLLGAAAAQLKKDAPAMIAYEQAAKLNPSHVRTWVDLGELNLRRLDYASAARALERAITLDPEGQTAAGKRAQVLIVKTLMTLEAS